MKTVCLIGLVLLAIVATASGVDLDTRTHAATKARLNTKDQTKAAVATEAEAEAETDTDTNAVADSSSELELESDTDLDTDTDAETDTDTDADTDTVDSGANEHGDSSQHEATTKSRTRSRFKIRGEFGAAAESGCGPVPRPPFCTMVNWPVDASIISQNTADAADMTLALTVVNFKGSRRCSTWLINLQCRSIWPDCSNPAGPLPCKSECDKFVSICQGSSMMCNSYPTSNCYTGGINAAPGRVSPLLWLLSILPVVVLALAAL